ncbi:type IV toxin-antitoxin system AbiEi family antitoxin domain-containing protein [Microbacterium sp.]|uniref:type IV toxin-antitoxin system AbiEi family antitoxin domain-containing protein n=1 Tax=Microbacterium sp. TaxID=51671 RepID=UPI0039E6DCB3
MVDLDGGNKGDGPRLLRTSDLAAAGWRARDLRAAVAQGRLTRVRQGAFCAPDADAECVAAGATRARLACVSELQRRGVFVLSHADRHVHVDPEAARLRTSPMNGRVHRERLVREPHPRSLSVEPIDAVRQAVLCQPPRATIATIDSALHLGVLPADDLEELFGALPRRFRRLRRLLDGRAESGPETLMRLILRSLGCGFEVQVVIVGVGRVDFVVDGWLIIECDSEAHHSSWPEQKRDRRRDQHAAVLGYATYRPIAEDIMWHAGEVRAAIAGLLASRHR